MEQKSSSLSSNIAPVIEEVLLEVDEYETQISELEKLIRSEETALLKSRQEQKKLQKEILTKQNEMLKLIQRNINEMKTLEKRFKDNEAADLINE
tara:strand:- start:212 stop:496 length:285 start_codon:yes stop_codon:yes gene_type:complete